MSIDSLLQFANELILAAMKNVKRGQREARQPAVLMFSMFETESISSLSQCTNVGITKSVPPLALGLNRNNSTIVEASTVTAP